MRGADQSLELAQKIWGYHRAAQALANRRRICFMIGYATVAMQDQVPIHGVAIAPIQPR